MRLIFPLFLLFFSAQVCHGQLDSLISVTGTLLDEDDNFIEFATVSLKENNLVTLSDNLGFFHLIVNIDMINDSLIIRHLGHQNKSIALLELISQKNSKILLMNHEYGLGEVKVKGLKALTLIKKARESIESNYCPDPYVYTGFYRQFHEENGQYVRLIEADVAVLDKGFYKEFRDERFKLNKLRRSHVSEKNGEAHGDHLSDLVHKNPIKHPLNTIFSKNGVKYYEFTINDIFSYDERTYYNVSFETKDKAHSQMLERGTLWVDTDDFSLLFYKIETLNDRGSGSDGGSGRFNWEFIGEAYELKFERGQDYLFPSEMKHTYTHNLRHNTFQSMDFEVIESFEFYMTDYYIVEEESEDKFKQSIDLYNAKYAYDAEFWESYLPLLNHPMKRKLIKDLEQNYPLDYQFEFQ